MDEERGRNQKGSRGIEQRKNKWIDKYGGSHRKAKNDYRKIRDKNIQKSGKSVEQKVKERKRRGGRRDEEEERVIYKVNCKDFNKVYIGETKFPIEKKNQTT